MVSVVLLEDVVVAVEIELVVVNNTCCCRSRCVVDYRHSVGQLYSSDCYYTWNSRHTDWPLEAAGVEEVEFVVDNHRHCSILDDCCMTLGQVQGGVAHRMAGALVSSAGLVDCNTSHRSLHDFDPDGRPCKEDAAVESNLDSSRRIEEK